MSLREFYVGPEAAHTPAFSKKTLFVVGFRETATIERLAKENKTPHISLGADRSFDATYDTEHFSQSWNEQVTYLLDKGFWVTLEYPAEQHEKLLRILTPGVWQCRLFVPLLRVSIPVIETSSPNLTVKVDDTSALNPGVWCLHYHEITDSNRFTAWGEFESADVQSVAQVRTASIIENLEGLVEPKATVSITVTETLNDANLGLDIVPTTALKDDPDAAIDNIIEDVKTPEDAAEAYADGAKVDPLSKEESKKPKSKK